MAQSGLEESLIQGLDTFIDSRSHVKACFVMMLLSFFLYIVGFATPGWLDGDSARTGLWTYCYSLNNYECCRSMEKLAIDTTWLIVARVFLGIGLVVGLVATVTIILKSVVESLVSNAPLQNVCITSCFLTAISIIIGASVYGGKYRDEPSLKDFNPSGSFVLCIIAGVTFLLCGTLLIFGAENTSVAPGSGNQGGSTSQPRAEPSAPPMHTPTHPVPAHGNPAQMTDDLNSCVVCMDNPIDTLFEPCMHSKCCRSCAESLNPGDCPVCRAQIREIKHIFR